jgi:hypothetical protein
VRHTSLRENWNEFLTVANLVVRNANEALVTPVVGLWWDLAESAFGGSLVSNGRFSVGVSYKDILQILYF